MNPPNPKRVPYPSNLFLAVISSTPFRFARKRNCSQFSRIRSASRSGSSLERRPKPSPRPSGERNQVSPVAPKGNLPLPLTLVVSPPIHRKRGDPTNSHPHSFFLLVTIPCHSHIPGANVTRNSAPWRCTFRMRRQIIQKSSNHKS